MDVEINIQLEAERLIKFGLSKDLLRRGDVSIARNNLFELLMIGSQYEGEMPAEVLTEVDDILNNMLQYCYKSGILSNSTATQRDLLSSRIMGCITPLPSEVDRKFKMLYASSPMEATDYYYKLCHDLDYIKRSKIKKNERYDHEESYGRIEYAINFSRVEKTAEELEAEKSVEETNYPKCAICKENVGFYGNLRKTAKQNLRVIPLKLRDEEWFLQYSPHCYYNEHCLVVDSIHRPMHITEKTFELLFDFVDKFPYYFLGSNADLPIVGDSFLSHSHFQGGCDMLPIEYAEAQAEFTHPSFKNVSVQILKWPVSIVRVEGDDSEHMVRIVNFIKNFWKNYTDEEANIYAFSDGGNKQVPHNAVSPVLRKSVRGSYEMDIMLRNNAVSEQHPYGIFNPKESLRCFKNDNVGMIDCMGLIVFPQKFDNEFLHIASYLLSGKPYEAGKKKEMDKYEDFINHIVAKYKIIKNYDEAKSVLLYEVGRKCGEILSDCGVFKLTDEGVEFFKRFMKSAGFKEVK